MKSKVFVSTAVVVLVCGMALAAGPGRVNLDNVHQTSDPGAVRTNGNITNFAMSIAQVGPLQAQIGATVNTVGGVSHTTMEHMLLYAQIYDYPWAGGTPYNTFVSGSTQFVPSSSPDGGPYSATWSFTVPVANTFQAFGVAIAGWYPGVPGATAPPQLTGFWWDGNSADHYRVSYGPTTYIDATQPPTPTPPPGGYGGEPIPTLNWLGILAMIAIIGGIAVFVMVGRK